MMRVALLSGAFLFAAWAAARPTIEIIDGDSLRIQGEKFRIANIDAPEIHHASCPTCRQPMCPREEALGQLARQRLHELTRGDLSITHVPCIHRPRHEASRDRYGRTCILLKVPHGGRLVDAGDILIREGLATSFPGERKDWCNDIH